MPTIRERIDAAKQQEYLTVEQLALLTQYSTLTIYRRAKQIPGYVKLGKGIRFLRTAALTWGRQSQAKRDIRPTI